MPRHQVNTFQEDEHNIELQVIASSVQQQRMCSGGHDRDYLVTNIVLLGANTLPLLISTERLQNRVFEEASYLTLESERARGYQRRLAKVQERLVWKDFTILRIIS